MSRIRIEPAGEKHIEHIARFNSAMALETEGIKLNREIARAGVEKVFPDPTLGFYLVALSADQPVGCLLVTYEWSDWRNALFWWIQSVYVLPEYRRLGVFSMLYNRIRELAAREKGKVCGIRLYVDRDNLVARETYTKLGLSLSNYDMLEEQFLPAAQDNLRIRFSPIRADDRGWVKDYLSAHWGSEQIVTRMRLHQAGDYQGFIAREEEARVGLITFLIENRECEITSLNSSYERTGIGTGLIDLVRKKALESNCRRIWLVTTNDNMAALAFYQKRGFTLRAVYPDQLQGSRKLKPSIPLLGKNGIPLRDEIELEMIL